MQDRLVYEVDAGSSMLGLMLDIQECTGNEIQKHPVSRNQYPGSFHIADGFRLSTLSPMQYVMRL